MTEIAMSTAPKIPTTTLSAVGTPCNVGTMRLAAPMRASAASAMYRPTVVAGPIGALLISECHSRASLRLLGAR